ncbi:RNA polymerase sigma factor [Sphingobium sp. V4]|uniref:RNA polymerase sigma factor n=1 Tax=Sphingobium sp. V4 TaxID=3038927 RepID=UPI002558284C|nr:RNA polymerase sigma factor [Sphingobium sp. V4]WIW89573.1 RNA polymerase sigma factor [Sphingobium sp. V4]
MNGHPPPNGIASEQTDTDPISADFREIYREESPALVRFFRKRLRSPDEAEDLAQETLTRFLRASPVTQILTPQAYLKRIAGNLLRDRAESASSRLADLSVPLDESMEPQTPYDQHRELVGREELEHFNVVLQQLKPRTLEIFLMCRVDGYTYKEAAKKLGMTLFGIKWHMLKAIEHIDRHRRGR